MKKLIWSNSPDLLTKEELVITEGIEGAKRIDLDIDTDTERERTVENANWYKSEFTMENIESDYYVIDFGEIEYLRKIDFYLNGTLCVQSWCSRSELRLTVPKTMLKENNSLIAVVVENEKINMWPPGEGFVSYVPKGFTTEAEALPKKISVKPCQRLKIDKAEKNNENGILLSLSNGKTALVSMYQGGIFRVTYPYPQKNLMEEICDIPKKDVKPLSDFTVEETSDEIGIISVNKVIINKNDFAVSVEENGECMIKTQMLFTDNTMSIKNSLKSDDHIFGLGDNGINGIDKRGTMEDIWVIHDFEKCDLVVPFYISTEGYGFYMNSSFHSHFDMGFHDAENALITNYDLSGDIFYIPGGTPEKVLENYTALIGRPYMPTKWAFGFWQAGTCVMKEADARETVANYKKYDIPLEVICVDPPWQKEICTLKWNEKNWPDYKGFLKLLKDEDLKLVLWTAPFINKTTSEFEEMKEAGLFAGANHPEKYQPVNWWIGYDSGLCDFTNPDTQKWFNERIGDLMDMGVNGLKVDGGDNAEVPVCIEYHNGTNGRNAHNLAPHYFADAFKKAMEKKKLGERVITWQRSTYTTAGQFACKWGGDQWADFSGTRVLIKSGQGSGICGVPYWAQDIGGFCANENTCEELFVRSYQWGCMAPLARSHGHKVEPWAWSDRAREIAANCVRLRYRMMPYIYSLAHLAHETGRPIMYPLFFDHVEDANTYCCDYQYKFGKYFMVAPICDYGNHEDMSADREVYLPKNNVWYDYNTLERFEGGQTISYHAEYEIMPVFIAEGAIMPYGNLKKMKDYNIKNLTIDFFPGAEESTFTLYDDDGITLEYKDGVYDEVIIKSIKEADAVKISFNSGKIREDFDAKYQIRVFGETGPKAVLANGKNIEWKRDGKFVVFNVSYDTSAEMNIQINFLNY